MLICAPAKPRRASRRRTISSDATRTLSYSSRWRPCSCTRLITSLRGGSSVATSSLRRPFILRRRIPYQDGFPIGAPEIVFKFRHTDPTFGAIETLYGAGYSFADG